MTKSVWLERGSRLGVAMGTCLRQARRRHESNDAKNHALRDVRLYTIGSKAETVHAEEVDMLRVAIDDHMLYQSLYKRLSYLFETALHIDRKGVKDERATEMKLILDATDHVSELGI